MAPTIDQNVPVEEDKTTDKTLPTGKLNQKGKEEEKNELVCGYIFLCLFYLIPSLFKNSLFLV